MVRTFYSFLLCVAVAAACPNGLYTMRDGSCVRQCPNPYYTYENQCVVACPSETMPAFGQHCLSLSPSIRPNFTVYSASASAAAAAAV